MAEIGAVAFDVGNVLIDWLPEELVSPLAEATGLPEDRAAFAVGTLYVRPKRRLDLGDMTPRDFLAELNAIVTADGGCPIAFQTFLRVWRATVRERPGVTAVVRRLRPDLPYAIWSDTDPVHFGIWSRWLPFLSGARSIYVSFLAGAVKPTREFFLGALAALEPTPERVLFLDDRTANVTAARELGIRAEEVASLAELEAVLGAHGLLE